MSELPDALLWPNSRVGRFQVAIGEDLESVDWDYAVGMFLLASVRHKPPESVDTGQASNDRREVRTVPRSGRNRSQANIALAQGSESNVGAARRDQRRKSPATFPTVCAKTTLHG